MDKALFKDLMAAHGMPQVEYAVVRQGSPGWRWRRPLFVKPARLGSSVGISKAWSEADLDAALAAAFEHDPRGPGGALLDGMEVECSVLGHSDPIASQPGEIVIRTGDWYDYEAKYETGRDGADRARPAARARCSRRCGAWPWRCSGSSAARAWRAWTSSWRTTRVLVNELNTIPGFTSTSVYAKLLEASGIPYAELLDRLLRLARERHEEERRYRF